MGIESPFQYENNKENPKKYLRRGIYVYDVHDSLKKDKFNQF